MLMVRITLLFLLISSQAMAWSTDSLNRYNAKGKKDGYWKVFLDSIARPTDSAQSYFYGYETYDNGEKLFSYSYAIKSCDNYRLVIGTELPKKGNPVLLNLTFQRFDTQGRVALTQIYENGKPVFFESTQYRESPAGVTFKETFYYDRLYNGMPGSYYFTEGFSDLPLTEYWYRKGKRGWRLEKIK